MSEEHLDTRDARIEQMERLYERLTEAREQSSHLSAVLRDFEQDARGLFYEMLQDARRQVAEAQDGGDQEILCNAQSRLGRLEQVEPNVRSASFIVAADTLGLLSSCLDYARIEAIGTSHEIRQHQG